MSNEFKQAVADVQRILEVDDFDEFLMRAIVLRDSPKMNEVLFWWAYQGCAKKNISAALHFVPLCRLFLSVLNRI